MNTDNNASLDNNVTEITIDRNRATEVPGTPPKSCPNCGRQFSQLIKPKRQLQKKAKTIVAIGFVGSLLFAMLLWSMIETLIAWLLTIFDYIIIPGFFVRTAIILVVISAPAYGAALYAMRFPRTVHLKC